MAPALAIDEYRRTTLKWRHRAIVRALAEAFFSPDRQVSSERLDAFVEDVDRYISPASKTLRAGMLSLLVVIQWSPLVFGRFRTFTTLGAEERMRHLERLETSRVSRIALLVTAYKMVMTMLFYEDEEELRALGYPATGKRSLRVVQ